MEIIRKPILMLTLDDWHSTGVKDFGFPLDLVRQSFYRKRSHYCIRSRSEQ